MKTDQMDADVARLRAQNAELLEALKNQSKFMVWLKHVFVDHRGTLDWNSSFEGRTVRTTVRDLCSAIRRAEDSHEHGLKSDIITALQAERRASSRKLKGAKGMIEGAAKQFREYERIHKAKGTAQGEMKAAANAHWAKLFEDFAATL